MLMEEKKENKPGFGEDAVYDQSSRAEAVLDQILHSETEEEKPQADAESEVAVDEELKSRPILDFETGRDRARVLFVTENEQVLEEGSAAAAEYLELAGAFDETHVMILIPRAGKDAFVRAQKNVWFYKIHDKDWQNLPDAALRAAKEALTWNDTVRPDVIVGLDPFVAGLAAYEIARSFARPIQIHIKTDFQNDNFLTLHEGNDLRKRMAEKLLRQVKSVRVKTVAQRKKLAEQYRQINDLGTLPRFYNFAGLQTATPGFTLHEKYPGFAFVPLIDPAQLG